MRFPQPSFQGLQTAEEDEKPDVYIIANETEIEKGDTIQFELGGNRGDRPVTAEWDFGDGSELSNKKNPEHKYKEKGKFEVKLTVTDADGDVDSEEKNIVVKDPDATESNEDTGGDTNGDSNRIPVYNPYYFIFTFLTLMAISMVLIKKRIS
ncbi:MAG: PKD domain-containing protein [Promethearchaeota archaeon]